MLIIIFLMIFSFVDITMTFYQFFLVKKINIIGSVKELNPIFSRIIKNNPTPIKYIICSLIAQIFLLGILYFTQCEKFIVGFFTGLFYCIIMYHFHNICDMRKYIKRKKIVVK